MRQRGLIYHRIDALVAVFNELLYLHIKSLNAAKLSNR
jgi:hypothetical protein